MKWIQSTDLVQWADRKECEGKLPELIRKLIIAACPIFPDLSIPSGDSIYKPGWDGQCKTEVKHGYVPEGISLWEFGRDEDFKAKCNREYEKRTKQTPDLERLNSTFVFVTPRRWVKSPLKSNWIKAKMKANEWKDVIIYDADDLECWLEQEPAIGYWLAKELEKFTDGVESADEYWNQFIANGDYTFTPELIISGRHQAKNQIQEFLLKNQGTIEIQSSSKKESICFFISSAIEEDEIKAQQFFSKAIIVSDKDVLKQITSIHRNLIIIYNANDDETFGDFDSKSNLLINPVSYEVLSKGIVIPIPQLGTFTTCLEKIGFQRDNASSKARQCGRSFSVLKRILSDIPGRTNWRSGNDILELVPIFFVQKFDDNNNADKKIVERFSCCSFDTYKERLKKWSIINDNPVYQIANFWRVVSPYDLLHVLAKYITEEHLKHFEDVVFEVIGEIDPALDLEPKVRYASVLYGKNRAYSSKMRDGLAQTLLLLSVYGESSGINISFDIRLWVNSIIMRLLKPKDIASWQSFEDKLTLLAEASPEVFLSAIEELIKESPSVIAELFNDQQFDLFMPIYHTHILWALESIAWNPDYFSRVILILSNLAELDKGERLSNRPINTLRSVFLYWMPQTYADFDCRKAVLEMLIKRKPEIAFKLLKMISPSVHDTGHCTQKPLYRLKEFSPLKISGKERKESISFILENILSLTGNKADNWIEIIELIDDYFGENRSQIINTFVAINEFEGELDPLRDKLRSFIQRHETYSKQDWALKEEELSPLKEFLSKLISSLIDEYYWYFKIDCLEGRRTLFSSVEEADELLKNKRLDAISSIYQHQGIDGIKELIHRSTKSEITGNLLAEVVDTIDDEIFSFLSGEEEKLHLMAVGYIYKQAINKGFEWINEKLGSIILNKSSQKLSHFFLSIQPSLQLWELLNKQSSEIQEKYWSLILFNPYNYTLHRDLLSEELKILLSKGRYSTCLNQIRSRVEKVDSETIIQILEGVVSVNNVDVFEIWNGSYYITELFKELDKYEIDPQKMQLLEWYYFEILNDTHSSRPIKFLFKALENDPSFFAQLISWIYIPENGSPEKEIEDKNRNDVVATAKNAHALIESWSSLPGMNDTGEIDTEQLKSWVYKAIDECKNRDRENWGCYEIGKMFGSIKELSNNWPQPEICQLIEELNNEEINKGFYFGAVNGKHVEAQISPVHDGSPEHEMAIGYRSLAKKLSVQFPIVARLLNEIAGSHERWGRHMEIEDKQRILEY